MWAYTVVGGRVGRRSEAILLIKRWGIDPNKLAIKPDESLRTIALQPRSTFPQMSVCIARRWPSMRLCVVCVRANVAVCLCTRYTRTHTRTEYPLFPVCRLVEVGDPEGGPKRGGARDAGGENKLISLTQPAVTPPQHDINPKPRLSLFKLYESLCRRIGREGELRGRLSIHLSPVRSFSPPSPSLFLFLYPTLALTSLFRSYIPSLVGYKREYTVRKEGKLQACARGIFTAAFPNIPRDNPLPPAAPPESRPLSELIANSSRTPVLRAVICGSRDSLSLSLCVSVCLSSRRYYSDDSRTIRSESPVG